MTAFQIFGVVTMLATFGVVIVCAVLYARILQKRHFKCPYCGRRFKSPPVKTLFSSTRGADRLLVCPGCGKSGYMEFMHDEDYTDDVRQKEPEERAAREEAEETAEKGPAGDE